MGWYEKSAGGAAGATEMKIKCGQRAVQGFGQRNVPSVIASHIVP